jgi:tRNA dimethylallyltransferase
MNLRPIIVIAGPTATGKSELAIKLAKAINGVIINADSRQIYQEISIGTARPSEIQLALVPHLLYGTVSVKDNYNVYRYQKDVFKILENLPKEQTPILVGGTGLYIDSVIYNYNLKSSSEVIQARKERYSQLTVIELQKQIPNEIFEKLNNSDKNNPRRLQRIIERGNTLKENNGDIFPNKYFVIDLPKDILRLRVEKRVDDMFANGLIEENRKVQDAKLNTFPPLNSIGYQEFIGYFENKKTLKDVREEIIIHTMQYIKRQRTWFKRNPDTIYTTEFDSILKESRSLLKYS